VNRSQTRIERLVPEPANWWPKSIGSAQEGCCARTDCNISVRLLRNKAGSPKMVHASLRSIYIIRQIVLCDAIFTNRSNPIFVVLHFQILYNTIFTNICQIVLMPFPLATATRTAKNFICGQF
jgi:hypothetical protein